VETDFAMAAVAEGFARGGPAPAQGDFPFAIRHVRIVGAQDFKVALHDQRTVGQHFNDGFSRLRIRYHYDLPFENTIL
jgi:hypothetical protein